MKFLYRTESAINRNKSQLKKKKWTVKNIVYFHFTVRTVTYMRTLTTTSKSSILHSFRPISILACNPTAISLFDQLQLSIGPLLTLHPSKLHLVNKSRQSRNVCGQQIPQPFQTNIDAPFFPIEFRNVDKPVLPLPGPTDRLPFPNSDSKFRWLLSALILPFVDPRKPASLPYRNILWNIPDCSFRILWVPVSSSRVQLRIAALHRPAPSSSFPMNSQMPFLPIPKPNRRHNRRDRKPTCFRSCKSSEEPPSFSLARSRSLLAIANRIVSPRRISVRRGDSRMTMTMTLTHRKCLSSC